MALIKPPCTEFSRRLNFFLDFATDRQLLVTLGLQIFITQTKATTLAQLSIGLWKNGHIFEAADSNRVKYPPSGAVD